MRDLEVESVGLHVEESGEGPGGGEWGYTWREGVGEGPGEGECGIIMGSYHLSMHFE